MFPIRAPGSPVTLTGFFRQPEAATVRTNPITNRFANLFSFIFFSFSGGLIWPNSVVIVS
jgi:hypothetical protein